MTKPITHPLTGTFRNTLFYGDNLPILREHIPDESIDLVYLDPPFNSNRSYNVLFKDERGEEAAIGVFVTLEPPSNEMITEAVSAGYFQSKAWQKDYPRIQILTVEDLLAGKGIDMPPSAYGTFKQAEKVKKQEGKQGELPM